MAKGTDKGENEQETGLGLASVGADIMRIHLSKMEINDLLGTLVNAFCKMFLHR